MKMEAIRKAWKAVFSRSPRRMKYAAVPKFQDAKALCAFVASNLRYLSDRNVRETWARPEETWARGGGDCEDLALVVYDLCRKNNIACGINTIFSARYQIGHVYVAGSDKRGAWTFSNNMFWYDNVALTKAADGVARSLGWSKPYHVMAIWPETLARLVNAAEKKGGANT